MPENVKVVVDQVTCEGTAFCVRTLPTVFSLNDDGVAQVADEAVSSVSLDELREIESLCPTIAIRVIAE